MAKAPPKPKAPPAPWVKKTKRIAWGIFGTLFVVFIIWGFMGAQYGDMRYGICYVYAQRDVPFPGTLKVRDYRYIENRVQIWVTYIDAAGQYNYQSYDCAYKNGFELTKVRKNNTEQSPEIVSKFNIGIKAILSNPPDLRLPHRPSDVSLKELWHGDY